MVEYSDTILSFGASWNAEALSRLIFENERLETFNDINLRALRESIRIRISGMSSPRSMSSLVEDDHGTGVACYVPANLGSFEYQEIFWRGGTIPVERRLSSSYCVSILSNVADIDLMFCSGHLLEEPDPKISPPPTILFESADSYALKVAVLTRFLEAGCVIRKLFFSGTCYLCLLILSRPRYCFDSFFLVSILVI